MTNTVRPEENMTIGNHIQSVVIKFVNHYNLIKFKVESFIIFLYKNFLENKCIFTAFDY